MKYLTLLLPLFLSGCITLGDYSSEKIHNMYKEVYRNNFASQQEFEDDFSSFTFNYTIEYENEKMKINVPASSSVRFDTKNSGIAFMYGRLELRMKIANSNSSGIYFYMLGNNGLSFPSNGEIDIANITDMEVLSALFYPQPDISLGIKYSVEVIGGYTFKTFNDKTQWHTYQMEWTSQSITTSIDNQKMGTIEISEEKYDLFHQEFYFVIHIVSPSSPTSIILDYLSFSQKS